MLPRSISVKTLLRSSVKLFGILLLTISYLCFQYYKVRADTPVGGPIISDTVWDLAHSPYLATSNVEILAGITLTIQPGVIVKFDTGKSLQVDGTLIARGTIGQPITFTSSKVNPQPGDWGNITFMDTSVDALFDASGNYQSGSILENSIIEFGYAHDGPGLIETVSASPYINQCIITKNKLDYLSPAILGQGTDTVPIIINENQVYANNTLGDYGIKAQYASITGNTIEDIEGWDAIYLRNGVISGNNVSNNQSATLVEGYYVTITDNLIHNNQGNVIYAENATVQNNQITDNSGRGISAHDSLVSDNLITGNTGGGISAGSNITVRNNTIRNNSADDGGGIFILSGSNFTIQDNIITGNIANHAGGGIYAMVFSNLTIENNTIVGNVATGSATGSGIIMYGGSGDFVQNIVIGNYSTNLSVVSAGVSIGTGINFHKNTIYQNAPYDAEDLSSSDVDASNNYWGTNSTTDILAHTYDWYDNTSRGRLLYIPYLQDPDPNAPVPPPRNLILSPANMSISLSWDAIPSTTTGYGYKIFYKTGYSGPPYDGRGLDQGDSPIDVAANTNYILTGLASSTYCFAVTAYDTLGHLSWYSNEVCYNRLFIPIVIK